MCWIVLGRLAIVFLLLAFFLLLLFLLLLLIPTTCLPASYGTVTFVRPYEMLDSRTEAGENVRSDQPGHLSPTRLLLRN